MKNIDDLKSKYWKGSSDEKEEQELKTHFAGKENSDIEDVYFSYLQHKKEEKLDSPDFDKEILNIIKQDHGKIKSYKLMSNWQIAATVFVIVSFGILLVTKQISNKNQATPSRELAFVDTYDDPEKAYEETKKALLMVSGYLNKGEKYTAELVKFSEIEEKLKK